jgi:hypothetical protein
MAGGPAESAVERVQSCDGGYDRDDLDVALLSEPTVDQLPDPPFGDAPGIGRQAMDRFHGLAG